MKIGLVIKFFFCKCLIKINYPIGSKYKMIKYNKIIIYLKRTIKKLNKYIEDKYKIKYKKLKVNILNFLFQIIF